MQAVIRLLFTENHFLIGFTAITASSFTDMLQVTHTIFSSEIKQGSRVLIFYTCTHAHNTHICIVLKNMCQLKVICHKLTIHYLKTRHS